MWCGGRVVEKWSDCDRVECQTSWKPRAKRCFEKKEKTFPSPLCCLPATATGLGARLGGASVRRREREREGGEGGKQAGRWERGGILFYQVDGLRLFLNVQNNTHTDRHTHLTHKHSGPSAASSLFCSWCPLTPGRRRCPSSSQFLREKKKRRRISLRWRGEFSNWETEPSWGIEIPLSTFKRVFQGGEYSFQDFITHIWSIRLRCRLV